MAFTLAGLLVFASVALPAGLEAFTQWSWAVGLSLVALAVLSVSVGLFGLYPQVSDRVPGLAGIGAVAAAIAGVVAVGLLAFVGITVVGETALGMDLPRPMNAFVVVTLSMVGGLSVGLLLLGVATLRTDHYPRTVGRLLVAGGVVLLAPAVVAVLGLLVGFETPAWVVFLAIALLAVDVLSVGYGLRSSGTHP